MRKILICIFVLSSIVAFAGGTDSVSAPPTMDTSQVFIDLTNTNVIDSGMVQSGTDGTNVGLWNAYEKGSTLFICTSVAMSEGQVADFNKNTFTNSYPVAENFGAKTRIIAVIKGADNVDKAKEEIVGRVNAFDGPKRMRLAQNARNSKNDLNSSTMKLTPSASGTATNAKVKTGAKR